MMTRLPMWAAAAALSLYAGSGVALAAEPKAEAPKAETPRTERREVRIYRHEGGSPAAHKHGGRHPHIIVMRGQDRSEQLRTLLQLRPEQDGALKAFVEAVAPPKDGGPMRRADRVAPPRTTGERLAEMEARMVEHQADTRRRIAATRTFYDQHDARQKKVFDAMPMLMFAGPGFGPMPLSVVHRVRPHREHATPPAPRS